MYSRLRTSYWTGFEFLLHNNNSYLHHTIAYILSCINCVLTVIRFALELLSTDMTPLNLCFVFLVVSLFSTSVSAGPNRGKYLPRYPVGEETEKKCEEYSKFGKNDKDECHNSFFKSLHRDEQGEYTATHRQFPHLVTVGNNGFKFTCRGALLSETFVLSVAHCTKRLLATTVGAEVTKMWAVVGDNDIKSVTNTSGTKAYLVEKIYIHPNYTSNPVANDISLVELEDEIEFDERIRPACVSTKKEVNGSSISGWGINVNTGEGMSMSKLSLKTLMNIFLEGKTISKQLSGDGSMGVAARNPRRLLTWRGTNDSCQATPGHSIPC
ncbi:cationic trypsin isoform X2 [Nilaparvata lugens]|uniref:cationic trypsin isoform X2 n=1 Tax=Nilaparvata lugens TaxID=108931 RepID=UPI00193CF7F5|nr:cationic trypsin isoform X2 [Nilaparvata lugens]